MTNKFIFIFLLTVYLSNFSFSIENKPGYKMNELKISIIPKPLKMTVMDGEFTFTAQTKILIDPKNKEIKKNAEYFAEILLNASGIKLKITGYSDKNDTEGNVIFTTRDSSPSLGDEGYCLDVNKSSITLKANTPNGIFYGIQSLRQLLPVEIESAAKTEKDIKWSVPCVSIEDVPRFEWRGLSLDVSRHFFPKEFVKKYIDYIAMHKMNVFHWHLTDDQGWRIEIKKYPKLTEIGAWRVDREHLNWRDRERQKEGEKPTYGGFYTQKDIKEIVEYAKNRYITVVPEIEMPAHCLSSLSSYPEYSCTGGPFTVPPGTYWPNSDIYCAGNDKTFKYLENILTEVISLFPSKFIHIGGDEATKDEWKKCPKCQARIAKEKLKDVNELQSYFVKRIEKFLISKKKRLIGWDEILEGGLAPEAAVMSWRGIEGGIAAATEKHNVVMTPNSHCYFDYYNGPASFEPTGIGGFLPLKKVYSYEPIPELLTPEEGKYILGAQANLWTEYIPTPEHAEYMVMPRLAALAEVTWTKKELKNWDDFTERMNNQYKRYDILKINYAKSPNIVNIITKSIEGTNKFILTFENETFRPEIYYTIDGSEPTIKSNKYEKPVELSGSAQIKAVTLKEGKPLTKYSELNLNTHKAFSLKADMINQPHSRYKDACLTDGLLGSKEHASGQWLGFQGDDFECSLSLGDSIGINTITTRFMQNINSWIFLPVEVEYFISNNGKDYKSISQFTVENDKSQKEISIREFKGELKDTKARYIKIKAKNMGTCPEWHSGKGDKAWIFIDEVVVE